MSDDRSRLDKWLWQARFCKTRAQAAALCVDGLIQLNGGIVRKPAQAIKIGDVISIPRGPLRVTVEILGLAARRGSYAEASRLYRRHGEALPDSANWEPLLAESVLEG